MDWIYLAQDGVQLRSLMKSHKPSCSVKGGKMFELQLKKHSASCSSLRRPINIPFSF
jgi:hypothetical protein